MANTISQPPVIFLVFILLASCYGSMKIVNAQVSGQRTWCVAKDSASNQALQNNLDYACSKVDCSIIRPGGSCFSPNTLMNHASVAMNLYYQANHRNPSACDFNGSGTISTTDPSWGKCKYA